METEFLCPENSTFILCGFKKRSHRINVAVGCDSEGGNVIAFEVIGASNVSRNLTPYNHFFHISGPTVWFTWLVADAYCVLHFLLAYQIPLVSSLKNITKFSLITSTSPT